MSPRNVASAKGGWRILVGDRIDIYRDPKERTPCAMPDCKTILSRYNDENICAACGKKIEIVVKRRKRKVFHPEDK